jgi:hypothetical protein
MLTTPCLDAALAYAAFGLRIVPLYTASSIGVCSCGRTGCKTPGKHPRLDEWPKLASTDEVTIRAWWTTWSDANVGVAMGHGLVDIEVDPRHGGDEHILAVEKVLGELPDTVTWISGGGGAHRLYRVPDQVSVRNATSIARELIGLGKEHSSGIDVRGDGGLAVMPPSLHESGALYRWGTLYPGSIDIAPIPERWLEYLTTRTADTCPAVSGNPIPEGTRNSALMSLGGSMRRVGMTEPEILVAIERINQDRCQPPLDDGEVVRIAHSVSRYEPHQVATAVAEQHFAQDRKIESSLPIANLDDLVVQNPEMREPLITGLLRIGETMNVIAAPKVGKSWLVLSLALAIGTGRPWLGSFQTRRGRVLIIDNELHPETTAFRVRTVLEAHGISMSEVGKYIDVVNLRGRLMDLQAIGKHLMTLEPGHYQLVIVDAWYRAIPAGTDENDNGAVAGLYNSIDAIANRLRCSFVLIHHTSKGNQAGKAVTDVGAGAGSQSRATDVHLTLRRHREENAVVLDAVVRSWHPPQPICLRWEFPLWRPAPELDPTDLDVWSPKRQSSSAKESAEEVVWDSQKFVKTFLNDQPRSLSSVVDEAAQFSLSERRVKGLLDRSEEQGFIHRWRYHDKGRCYATIPQPPNEHGANDHQPSKRQMVESFLAVNPEATNETIAEKYGVTLRYLQRIRAKMDGGNDHE